MGPCVRRDDGSGFQTSSRPRERGDPYAVPSMFRAVSISLLHYRAVTMTVRGYGSPLRVRNCALGGDDIMYGAFALELPRAAACFNSPLSCRSPADYAAVVGSET